MWRNLFVFQVALVILTTASALIDAAKFDFPQSRLILSKDVRTYLNGISAAQWQEFVDSGIDSIEKEKRLEINLLNSDITVQNGSLSHAQLLDTLPNRKSKRDSDIALKILRSSLFAYNSKCVPNGINGDECRTFLETKPLPESSDLRSECSKLLHGQRDGHHAFRRLLPRRYKNGFHEMFDEALLPASWSVSKTLYEPEAINTMRTSGEDESRNLVLVQWAQFVEHDLSKPVVTSMSSGSPIECCNRNQNNLQPRYHHPQCAPILLKDAKNKFGWQSCLNYVRSALAVGSRCNFGAAEQLNQATGSLDLSQLYGFTAAAERKMRTFKHGNLKSTSTGAHLNDLLPMTTDDDGHTFCAWGASANISTCFAAGDSRVNNNPYSILVYTIFMRNHNRLAAELHSRNPSWNDQQLFDAAKAINVDIYRRIVMDEWLPVVLGSHLAADVLQTRSSASLGPYEEVSNEFGVAAMRFYFSMLPNILHNFATGTDADINISNNNILPLTNLFMLKDEIYKPQLQYTAKKLDDILESLLHQRAMKMDASYVGDLVWHVAGGAKPTHADVLAFDIQRGRDHGLQPYFKYLEVCSNVKINGWNDIGKFIAKEHITKLQNVYKSWSDVDLIVGGIAERPVNGTVGPTFSCILAEQFSRIHQRHQEQSTASNLLQSYNTINGSKLLCLNSGLKAVPQNIFQLSDDSNRLIDCDGLV